MNLALSSESIFLQMVKLQRPLHQYPDLAFEQAQTTALPGIYFKGGLDLPRIPCLQV